MYWSSTTRSAVIGWCVSKSRDAGRVLYEFSKILGGVSWSQTGKRISSKSVVSDSHKFPSRVIESIGQQMPLFPHPFSRFIYVLWFYRNWNVRLQHPDSGRQWLHNWTIRGTHPTLSWPPPKPKELHKTSCSDLESGCRSYSLLHHPEKDLPIQPASVGQRV